MIYKINGLNEIGEFTSMEFKLENKKVWFQVDEGEMIYISKETLYEMVGALLSIQAKLKR